MNIKELYYEHLTDSDIAVLDLLEVIASEAETTVQLKNAAFNAGRALISYIVASAKAAKTPKSADSPVAEARELLAEFKEEVKKLSEFRKLYPYVPYAPYPPIPSYDDISYTCQLSSTSQGSKIPDLNPNALDRFFTEGLLKSVKPQLLEQVEQAHNECKYELDREPREDTMPPDSEPVYGSVEDLVAKGEMFTLDRQPKDDVLCDLARTQVVLNITLPDSKTFVHCEVPGDTNVGALTKTLEEFFKK